MLDILRHIVAKVSPRINNKFNKRTYVYLISFPHVFLPLLLSLVISFVALLALSNYE